MRILHAGLILALATSVFADTVKLKNGRVVQGTYLGGSARQVRMEVGDQIQTLDVADIDRIEFGGEARRCSRPRPGRPRCGGRSARGPSGVDAAEPGAALRAPAVGRLRGHARIAAGTNLAIRMIDAVDSEVAKPGQTFQASLDQPVVIAENVAIPRGADVVVKLVDAKESGTFTGRAELALSLQSVKVNGRTVEMNTQTVSRESDSQGSQTAKRAGVGAVVGAGLGAVFGGGKGAATGAAVGGAAGAGTQAVTKGRTVRIPSETRLTFVLDTPVRI